MKVHHYSRALSWITRPRVTETATLETFTPELDRMDFNPGGRVGCKHGGSWADWMSNHSGQMTFEEYLQMDMPKPVHPVDKSMGGRVGMKPGGLVEPGVTHYAKDQIYNPQWYKAQKKLDLQRVTNPDPKAYQEMEKIIDDLLVESDIKGTKVKHLPQDITIQQLRNKVTTPGYKRSAVSNELFKQILNKKKGITYDNYRARKIATVLNEALEKSGGNILSIKPSVAVQLLPEFKVKGIQTKGGQGGNILKTYKNYLTGSARLANRAGIPIPETFGKKPLNTILTELETNFLDILGGRARGSFDVLNEVKLLDKLAN